MAGVRTIQTPFACCRHTPGMLQVNFYGGNNINFKLPTLYFGTRQRHLLYLKIGGEYVEFFSHQKEDNFFLVNFAWIFGLKSRNFLTVTPAIINFIAWCFTNIIFQFLFLHLLNLKKSGGNLKLWGKNNGPNSKMKRSKTL